MYIMLGLDPAGSQPEPTLAAILKYDDTPQQDDVSSAGEYEESGRRTMGHR